MHNVVMPLFKEEGALSLEEEIETTLKESNEIGKVLIQTSLGGQGFL